MMLKMSQKTRQTTSTLTIDGIAWISAFTTTCRYHSNHHISSTSWGVGMTAQSSNQLLLLLLLLLPFSGLFSRQPGVKMLRSPFIFWLYTCKNIIADTNRQSNMHIIACGIICHQNWRIGPSLEAGGVDSYSLKEKKILLINETLLVNIVEFIHS